MKTSEIKYIVTHASDTRPSMDIGVEEIRGWHINERKWSDIGYHFVIRRGGIIETGRPLDIPGAHVRGFNNISWGICMVGGMAENGDNDCNFTKKQYFSLDTLITELLDKAPQAIAQGHRDFKGVIKTCPNFNVGDFYYD